jgi:RES domain-containing protein
MIVYRIAKEKWINDLSGEGAKRVGGRWNPVGYPVIYCSSNSSLALLETLVHLDFDLIPLDLRVAEIEIPDESIKTISETDLPEKWRDYPSSDELKIIGKTWIDENKYLTLKIPSAVNPKEFNYLLNINHRFMDQVRIIKSYSVSIDSRFRT